ncbi:hypothetical protein JYQ62_15045 [Nostoc sp. UHCC 0702]|nr:hypothetical protein JYQ62_15045 [Nostoc sp. UHCC 0702]
MLNFVKLQLVLMCHTQYLWQFLGTLLIYIRFIKSCHLAIAHLLDGGMGSGGDGEQGSRGEGENNN